MRKTIDRLKVWAKRVKQEAHILHLAGRDPRTPKLAKWLAIAIAAYAVSPIDLIPDFIPVIGYLDELILLPLAIIIVRNLIPADLMAEFRMKARQTST